jgi:hypothetical protein
MNKVWTFLIGQQPANDLLEQLTGETKAFVKGWTAHDHQLTASVEIFKNRIIIIKVDESNYGASGCSIDKLTRFIKELEKKHGISLLNRMLVAYKKDDEIFTAPASSTGDLLSKGTINENSIVYDTAVSNEEELKNWEQPLKRTWLKKYLLKA